MIPPYLKFSVVYPLILKASLSAVDFCSFLAYFYLFSTEIKGFFDCLDNLISMITKGGFLLYKRFSITI